MKNRIVMTRLAWISMGIMLFFGTAACGQEALSERVRIDEDIEDEQVIEDELATGYLKTMDGMVVHSENPYYPELIQLIDTIATAPEERCDDSDWVTLWQLKHSSGTTGITIQSNKDMRGDTGEIYQDVEDYLNHCCFRISGTIRGEKIDRCIAYGTGLQNLQSTLEKAKSEELMQQAETEENGKTDGFEALYQGKLMGMVLLMSDEMGQILMLTDSDLTELESMSGRNRRVRVYDFRPVTDEEAAGFDPKPQIVGKIEFIEAF